MNKYTKERRVPVFRSDGCTVGYIKGDFLFKNAFRSRHMVQKPPGWAWDVHILEEAERVGATKTKIFDKESGYTYTATIKDFWDRGVSFKRGYGLQLCLPIAYWNVNSPGTSRQLELFV